MNEETSNIDNGDLDLTGVVLSPPVFDKQTRRCITGQVKRVKNGDKLELEIPLRLDEPATDTNGKEHQVGAMVGTQRILMTPTGGLTMDIIKEKLARFQAAVLDIEEPRKWGNDADYQGKPVYCRLKAKPKDGDPTVVFQDVASWISPTRAAKAAAASAGSGSATL